MISGYTGEAFRTDIFIGPVYYQRLRHMVSDKFQVSPSHHVLACHKACFTPGHSEQSCDPETSVVLLVSLARFKCLLWVGIGGEAIWRLVLR